MLSVVTVGGGGGGGGGPILYPGCWWWGWPTKAAPHRHHRGSTPHIYKKLVLVLAPPPDRGWSWVKVDSPSPQHRRRNPPRECDGVAAGILNFDIDEYAIFGDGSFLNKLSPISMQNLQIQVVWSFQPGEKTNYIYIMWSITNPGTQTKKGEDATRHICLRGFLHFLSSGDNWALWNP